MSEINLFEVAARKKFRFSSPKGQLSVEDLFDLPLTSTTGKANLDDIARQLHQELESGANISFVAERSADTTLKQRFDLVKHVIDTKLEEGRLARERQDKAARRQEIMAALVEAQQGALRSKTPEELQKMLDELG